MHSQLPRFLVYFLHYCTVVGGISETIVQWRYDPDSNPLSKYERQAELRASTP